MSVRRELLEEGECSFRGRQKEKCLLLKKVLLLRNSKKSVTYTFSHFCLFFSKNVFVFGSKQAPWQRPVVIY